MDNITFNITSSLIIVIGSVLGTGLVITLQNNSFLRDDLRRERDKNDRLDRELFELKYGKWRDR